jgi:hypothetical protein
MLLVAAVSVAEGQLAVQDDDGSLICSYPLLDEAWRYAMHAAGRRSRHDSFAPSHAATHAGPVAATPRPGRDMTVPAAFPPALCAIAAGADQLRWDELWVAVSREQREEALRTFLSVESRRSARQLIAQSIVKGGRGYSLNKLLGQSNSELARLGARQRRLMPTLGRDVLIAWLLEQHGHLQRYFFEATGNGTHCDEHGAAIGTDFGTADPSLTQRGCDAVLTADPDLGLIYLLALCVEFADRWSGIRSLVVQWAAGMALPELPASASPEQTVAMPEHEAADATAEEPAAALSMPVDGELRLRPVPEPQLTILDDLLTKTILSAWAGAEHGLSRAELFALLDEVVSTNTERRRTNFHLGYADALFEEPWRAQLSARSEERRAWYAAGYLMGVARRADSEQVAEYCEQQADARLLVERPWAPFEAAADAILPALVVAQRHDALARMAPVVTMFSHRAVEVVGEQGRLALVRHDPGMALAFLQPAVERTTARLQALPAGVSTKGRESLERFDHDLRRRLAHAYRLTGASNSARAVLETLLGTEQDAVIRGMILTDLALLDVGLRELAEVHVPDDGARHEELASLFTPVERLLYDAMPDDGPPSAHAAYVLGVVALLRAEWKDAAANLRVGLDAFEARPMAYTGRGVLRLARLYTATAELLALDEEEVARRAAERLRDMVQAGERPPRCFLQDLVGHALLVDQAVGESLVSVLLDRQVLSLETLASFGGTAEHLPFASAMATAALDEQRAWTSRVDLAYRALPAMVRGGDADSVEALLGVLEDGAASGIAADRFLDLLEHQRECWELCWDLVDAKWSGIRVNLSNGHTEQARDGVRVAFYAVIGNPQQRYDWVGEAEDLIEALRRCGGSDSDVADCLRRLPASPVEAAPVNFRPNVCHSILVVGGNEVQRRFELELAASLQAEFGNAIRIACHTTGMTSNWIHQLEKVERLLPATDGVVISRFIRTNFGRNLRRQLGTRPWRTCGSAGMGRMRALVVELASELERQAVGADG